MTMMKNFLLVLLLASNSDGQFLRQLNTACHADDLTAACPDESVQGDSLVEACPNLEGIHVAKCFYQYLCTNHDQAAVDRHQECIDNVCPMAKRIGKYLCSDAPAMAADEQQTPATTAPAEETTVTKVPAVVADEMLNPPTVPTDDTATTKVPAVVSDEMLNPPTVPAGDDESGESTPSPEAEEETEQEKEIEAQGEAAGQAEYNEEEAYATAKNETMIQVVQEENKEEAAGIAAGANAYAKEEAEAQAKNETLEQVMEEEFNLNGIDEIKGEAQVSAQYAEQGKNLTLSTNTTTTEAVSVKADATEAAPTEGGGGGGGGGGAGSIVGIIVAVLVIGGIGGLLFVFKDKILAKLGRGGTEAPRPGEDLDMRVTAQMS